MQSSIQGRIRFLVVVLAATVALAAGALRGAERIVGPAEARLRGDVTFLADDAREGRAPGTTGIEAAAEYVAAGFKEAGLKPAPGLDGYFQPFTLSGNPTLGPELALSLMNGPDTPVLKADPKVDFTPLAIGSGGTLDRVPVVFAGYGITAKDDAQKLDYDDYAGLDVKGKAVLIIRREPQQDKEESPFAGKRNSDFATFRHKATNAFQHGAAAVLLVNDAFTLKGDKAKDELLKFTDAGAERELEAPLRDGHPCLRRQADGRGRPAEARSPGAADRRRPEAPLGRAGRLDAECSGRHRAQVDHDPERGGRPRGDRAACRRDGRRGGPLRPPGPRGHVARARSRSSRPISTTGPTTTPRGRRWCSSWHGGWRGGPTRCPAGSSSSPSRARSGACSARSTTSSIRRIPSPRRC